MARGNPNIPLSATIADLATPIVQRRERDRQATMDMSNLQVNDSNLKTAEQQQTLNQQTITANNEAAAKTVRDGKMKLLAMNTLSVGDLLKSGNQREAGALLVQNMDLMEELGLPTERVGRFAMLAGVDPRGASKFFDEHVLPGIQNAAPEIFKQPLDPDMVKDGQTFTADPRGNVTAQPVAGYVAPAPDPVNNDLLQAVGADGSITPIQYNPRGAGFLTMDNKPYSLPQGATVTRTGTPQGAMSDVVPQSAEVKRRQREGSVRSFNDRAARAIELIGQNRDANTFVADLAALGTGILQEVGAVARFAGVPREVFDPGSYDSVFKELGIAEAGLQSVVTGLAYEAAAAKDITGNGASNKDVERFIRTIGANYSNPELFLSALKETVDDVNGGYANEYQALYGKPFDGDLGAPRFPNSGQSAAQQSGAPVVNSQADYDALPSGTVYVEDGQEYRKP